MTVRGAAELQGTGMVSPRHGARPDVKPDSDGLRTTMTHREGRSGESREEGIVPSLPGYNSS